MLRWVIALLVCISTCVAGCDRSVTREGQASSDKADKSSSQVVRLGPASEDEALDIAREYMKSHHPDLDISQKAPSAQFFPRRRMTASHCG